MKLMQEIKKYIAGQKKGIMASKTQALSYSVISKYHFQI